MPGPLEVLSERGLEAINRFYGTYRGVVVNDEDIDHQNRLRVVVPQIDNSIAVWAYPKGQQAHSNSGSKNLTPKKGSTVWVEYENGDPMYPIWSEGHWAVGEIPPALDKNSVMGFVTPNQNTLVIDEEDNSLSLTMVNSGNEENPLVIKILNGVLTIKGLNINLLDAKIGIPKSDLVVNKLNIIESQLNSLKQLFSRAPASAVSNDGGRAAFRIFSSWASQDIRETKISDIANEKIKQ